ncbi:hypothetical protein BpHYR1_051762 [Brachionus plicatilis]|uniref:Uncharacterized protein n=1 Tax=Brachionus plicatilis TaxID=10195 RepID=A0A3M7T183_BRAPC|nr:hypothetical protein BpHYR1_051762 [Brachionus plicatilis]
MLYVSTLLTCVRRNQEIKNFFYHYAKNQYQTLITPKSYNELNLKEKIEVVNESAQGICRNRQIERKNKFFQKQLLDMSCQTKKLTKNKIISVLMNGYKKINHFDVMNHSSFLKTDVDMSKKITKRNKKNVMNSDILLIEENKSHFQVAWQKKR